MKRLDSMAFQIQTPEGVAIPLNKLDEEAAAFWKLPVHPKSYVAPSSGKQSWFDVIGWYISNPNSRWTIGWDNIKCSIFNTLACDFALLSKVKILERLEDIHRDTKPYFDLIDHWQEKGYIPVQVKD